MASGVRLLAILLTGRAASISAAAASAFPQVSLEDDVLTVQRGPSTERHIVTLGLHEPLYDPPRENERVWRRSGSAGGKRAAAVLRRNPRSPDSDSAELQHIVVLWADGVLELTKRSGVWVAAGKESGAWAASETNVTTERRLGEQDWPGTRFEECWTGMNSGELRYVRVGLVVDRGFMVKYGGEDGAMAQIENIMSASNIIYEGQLHVHLAIGLVQLPSDTPWQEHPMSQQTKCTMSCLDNGVETTCDQPMRARFWEFKDFGEGKLTVRYDMGAWVHLTNCYPPPGVVGLALKGGLCQSARGYAVVTASDSTWLTFAHEVGHIFGAAHSFEDGEGETGGIMDYGDGSYHGIYQFHPYRKNEVCSLIERTMQGQGVGEVSQCWKEDPFSYEQVGSWSLTEWGSCQPTCSFVPGGTGTQSRMPGCFNALNKRVVDSHCKEEPPANETRTCTPQTCIHPYRWEPLAFGRCWSQFGLSCGAGQRHLEFECRDEQGNPSPGNCFHSPRPQFSELCELGPCTSSRMWTAEVGSDSWQARPTCQFPGSAAVAVRKIVCVDVNLQERVQNNRCWGRKPQPGYEVLEGLPACQGHDPEGCCVGADCLMHSEECLYKRPRVDAMACVEPPSSDPQLYVFFGSHFRRASKCIYDLAPGPLMSLREGFPGLPEDWDRIDTVLSAPKDMRTLLLFRGDAVWGFDTLVSVAKAGYPVSIAEAFPGSNESCPVCETGISAAVFEEPTMTLRLWCGTGDFYCEASVPWGEWQAEDWVLRPSQDFGTARVHAAFEDQVHGLMLLGVDGQFCAKGEAVGDSCAPMPSQMHFAVQGQRMRKCADLPFCDNCYGAFEDRRCSQCEPGYRLWFDRCVHYQTLLWLVEPRSVKVDDEFEASGARDPDDFSTWDYRPGGPFAGLRYLPVHGGRDMAPVLREGRLAELRRWSIQLWVRGNEGAVGDLLRAPQPDGSELRLLWSACGVSAYRSSFVNGSSLSYDHLLNTTQEHPLLRCDNVTFGMVSNERWVHVSINFIDDVAIRVNGRGISAEAEQIDLNAVLDHWTLGGADVDIGMVEILDHEVFPVLAFNQRAWLTAVGLCLAISLVGGFIFRWNYHLSPKKEIEWEADHKRQEKFVYKYTVLMGGVWFILGTGIVIFWVNFFYDLGVALTDVALSMTAFAWPLEMGLGLMVTGILGVRTARTRRGCALLMYVMMLSAMLWVSLSTLLLVTTSDDGIGGFIKEWVPGVPFSQMIMMKGMRDAFVAQMHPAAHDCHFSNQKESACSAFVSSTKMISCNSINSFAKNFEDWVNTHCSRDVDPKLCSGCTQNLGIRYMIEDWDATEPAQRAFCKCLTDIGQATWVQYFPRFLLAVILAMFSLMLAEVYTLSASTAKRKLLRRQVEKGMGRAKKGIKSTVAAAKSMREAVSRRSQAPSRGPRRGPSVLEKPCSTEMSIDSIERADSIDVAAAAGTPCSATGSLAAPFAPQRQEEDMPVCKAVTRYHSVAPEGERPVSIACVSMREPVEERNMCALKSPPRPMKVFEL